MHLNEWLKAVEWLDEMYHRGWIPEFVGSYICDRLEEWYWLGDTD